MFALALRYLLARKRQTVLILMGILLGTTAFVAISGMMLGFQAYLLEQLVNNDAHIRISSREEYITKDSLAGAFFKSADRVDWLIPPSGRRDYNHILYPQGWYEKMTASPQVVMYSPQLSVQVIATRGKFSAGATLMGSHPDRQRQVTNISAYMTHGLFTDIGESGNRLIVGEALLQKMGARVSENILISVGAGQGIPFRIVGAFRTGIKSIDESRIFGALTDVQRVNGTPSEINNIAVRIKDYDQARQLAEVWEQGSEEKVESWDQINASTLSIFRTQDMVRYMMTGSILVVAGFGIYNVLNMTVIQKRREIAILRSIGYEAKDILFLFAVQGIILGILGGLIGVLCGYGVAYGLSLIEVDPGRLSSQNGRMIISFAPSIYIKGFLLAFASATFASVFPAKSAGRLTPIEIIRSEGT